MDAIQNKTPETAKPQDSLTLTELLRRMDALHAEQNRLEETVAGMKAVPKEDNPNKLHAMIEVYAAHERTVQKELSFLEHIYDDRFSARVKSPKQVEREQVMQNLVQAAAQADPEIAAQMLKLVSDLLGKN